MVHALATALAAILIPVSGLRKIAAKTIAGVPILNYDLRHLQLEGGSLASAETQLDWVVGFSSKQATDKQLADFCVHDVKDDVKASCTFVGHPEEHGVALVVLRSTEDELKKVVEMHAANVKFIEPDIPVSLPEDNLESFSASVSASSTPWNLDRIGLSTRGSTTGRGSSIYVLDTGVRSTHEQFGGRVTPTLDTFLNPGTFTECNGDVNCATDYFGHGTHCAGTAAGKDYGAAPEANIYAMKVCCAPGPNMGTIIGGVDWLAQRVTRTVVVSMSLGNPHPSRSTAGEQAIDALVAAGATVLVAAGNRNTDTCTYTFGFIESAIAVGATNSLDERAWFSSWGQCNDIYAPGFGIPSAGSNSDTDYTTADGTSSATPLVAGVAALILEENPAYTPEEVRAKLLERAVYNALTNLRPGDPNILLYARPEGPPPTPVPPPPPACPSGSTGPDSSGDCNCIFGVCSRDGGSTFRCPKYALIDAVADPRFQPTCTDCQCVQCPSFSTGPDPWGGYCACNSGKKCSLDGGLTFKCDSYLPYLFLPSCTNCQCY
jgi:hypothetical protein